MQTGESRDQKWVRDAAAGWEASAAGIGCGTLSADSSALRQHSQAAITPVPDWQFGGRFLPQVNIF